MPKEADMVKENLNMRLMSVMTIEMKTNIEIAVVAIGKEGVAVVAEVETTTGATMIALDVLLNLMEKKTARTLQYPENMPKTGYIKRNPITEKVVNKLTTMMKKIKTRMKMANLKKWNSASFAPNS